MRDSSRDRRGSVPAAIAAGITFATVALYVAIIVSQGEADVASVIVIATYIAGLGACALAGSVRTHPDRVIPLGIASGGLIGAAVVSLFSIGLLLGGIGGAAAALAFLVVALLV
jgi:hypothetical protein